jgi:hypothetical protein
MIPAQTHEAFRQLQKESDEVNARLREVIDQLDDEPPSALWVTNYIWDISPL